MRSSWAHVRIRVRAYTHARTHARTSTHTLKCPRTHGRAQTRTHPGALPSHWPRAGGGGRDLQRAAEGLLGGGEGRVLGPRDGLQQAEDAPRPGPPAHCHGGVEEEGEPEAPPLGGVPDVVLAPRHGARPAGGGDCAAGRTVTGEGALCAASGAGAAVGRCAGRNMTDAEIVLGRSVTRNGLILVSGTAPIGPLSAVMFRGAGAGVVRYLQTSRPPAMRTEPVMRSGIDIRRLSPNEGSRRKPEMNRRRHRFVVQYSSRK